MVLTEAEFEKISKQIEQDQRRFFKDLGHVIYGFKVFYTSKGHIDLQIRSRPK